MLCSFYSYSFFLIKLPIFKTLENLFLFPFLPLFNVQLYSKSNIFSLRQILQKKEKSLKFFFIRQMTFYSAKPFRLNLAFLFLMTLLDIFFHIFLLSHPQLCGQHTSKQALIYLLGQAKLSIIICRK